MGKFQRAADSLMPEGTEPTHSSGRQKLVWQVENMQYLETEDSFVCAAQGKLRFYKACSKKAQGIAATCKYYRCEDCSGCPLQEQCTKFVDPNFRKEVKLCEAFAVSAADPPAACDQERGTAAHEPLHSGRGCVRYAQA